MSFYKNSIFGNNRDPWTASYIVQLPGEPELAFSLRPTEGIDPEKERAQNDHMRTDKELRYMARTLKTFQ